MGHGLFSHCNGIGRIGHTPREARSRSLCLCCNSRLKLTGTCIKIWFSNGLIHAISRHRSASYSLKEIAVAIAFLLLQGVEYLNSNSETHWFERVKQLADQVSESAQTAAQNIEETLVAVQTTGLEKAAEVQDWMQQSTQHSIEVGNTAIQQLQASIAGLGASGLMIADSLKDLPRTAADLSREMPKIAQRLRQGAGIRRGDLPRSDADMMGLFDKIPGPAKLGANERTIREFLADKHGSHIQPRSQGGSNGADNILWEVGSANMQRGAAVMTHGEQLFIRVYNAIDAILKNSQTIARLGLAATGTAILTQAVVTAISYALDLHRGDITTEEFRDKIIAAAVSAGIAAPIFFLLLVVIMALFPEFVVLLSAPAIAAGFNALFGLSIATPIIQSLIRHVEAGGFGPDVKAQYVATADEAQSTLQHSLQSAQQFGDSLLAYFSGAPQASES